MKILFFNRWVGVRKGGAETHIKELATRFARKGHIIDFLTLKGKELNNIGKFNRIYYLSRSVGESLFSYTDIRVFWYTLLYMIKSGIRLLWLKMRGANYNVVSVHFATEAMVMRILKPILKWPYVYICEGYSDLEAKIAKHADTQIAISKHIVENYNKSCDYKPLLISIGVDIQRFSNDYDKHKLREQILGKDYVSKFIALTVCRLFPDKDIPTLVQAARIIKGSNKDVVFIIVGDGGERHKIEEMVKQYNLTSTVILTGSVTEELLEKYYGLSDIFVLTEVRSGFSGGIVFFEAMSAGLPIVASDAGGTFETLEDFGILFPPRDPKALAEGVERVFEDKKLYQYMKQRGLTKVKNYDWNRLIPLYEKEYESVSRKY